MGRRNVMIAMTDRASRDSHLHEDLTVAALVEEFGVDGMTLAADISDPRNTRRRGAVIAVTVIARRCRQVSFAAHHLPVDALFIFVQLVSGNFIRRHVVRFGVTGTAGISHVERVDGRARIARGANRMGRMATGAGRDLRVVLFS
jgi:hypothetical protein